MNKDIEWAKKEIKELMTEESQNYPHDEMIEKEIVLGILNQLDEPEVLSQGWIDENSTYADFDGVTDEYVHVDDLKEMLVPKQELPVVPRFVAEWIKEMKQDERPLYSAMSSLMNKTNHEWAIWKTTNKNFSEIVAQAWLDGFTVEEEQKYFVSSRESVGFWFLSKNNDNEVVIGTNKDYYDRRWESLKLTEQEIKDYDSRYWAFAVKVEEMEK